MRYRFRAGDAENSPWFTINTRPPPALSEISVVITPPAYMKLPPRTANPLEGRLLIPVGSHVQLTASSNCPLQALASGPRPSSNEMQKVERLTTSPQPQVHTPSGAFATPKQIGYIKKLAKDKGMDDLALLEMIQLNLDDDSAVLELLKSHEASKIIERLK
jgi:hypothetical protein